MEPRNIRVYDLFDTLVTSNFFELCKLDDPELYRQAIVDVTPVRHKVLELDERYRKEGKIKTIQLPHVREGLERTLRKGHSAGVFSNGEPAGITEMLREGEIDDLFVEVISVSQVGDKTKTESYANLREVLGKRGYVLASYADDKANFCTAAVQSGVVPAVYHVNPKQAPSPEGCTKVASVSEID